MSPAARNLAGPIAINMPTPPRSVASSLPSDPLPASPSSSQPDTSQWRVNPHSAPQNTRTSQYIDKITSENERLKRELTAEKLARDEESKRLGAARARAEEARAELQTLQVIVDTNARAIERKDRKLDELKTAFEAETHRRTAAEQREAAMSRALGDTRSDTQRQLAKAHELQHQAEASAEAVKEGYRRITDSYERKLKAITRDLETVRRQRAEDADKIRRQAIISDQLHHEMSRTLRTEDSMRDMLGSYKREHGHELERLVADAEQIRTALPAREAVADALILDLAETKDKMKWVMAVKASQDILPSPPASAFSVSSD